MNNRPMLPSAPVVFKWDYSGLTDEDRQAVRGYVLQFKDCSRKFVQHAITMGNALIGMKRHLDHGQFESCTDAEFGISLDTAENMMNLAMRADEIRNASDFGLSVFYRLTAPSVTSEERSSVIKALEIVKADGTQITVNLAERLIREAKTRFRQVETALMDATPEVVEIVERYQVTDYSTVIKLKDLQKRQNRDDSSHTFDTIYATGRIQPGDEFQSVAIDAPYPAIEKALKSIGADHASVNDKRVKLFQGRAYVDGNGIVFMDDIPAALHPGRTVKFVIYEDESEGV